MQADSDSTAIDGLPEKQIRTYKNVQTFIKLRFSFFVFIGKSTSVLMRQLLYYFEEDKGRMTVMGSFWCCCSLKWCFICKPSVLTEGWLSICPIYFFFHSSFVHPYLMNTPNLCTPVYNFAVRFSYFTLAFHDWNNLLTLTIRIQNTNACLCLTQ